MQLGLVRFGVPVSRFAQFRLQPFVNDMGRRRKAALSFRGQKCWRGSWSSSAQSEDFGERGKEERFDNFRVACPIAGCATSFHSDPAALGSCASAVESGAGVSPLARAARIQGTVVLGILINKGRGNRPYQASERASHAGTRCDGSGEAVEAQAAWFCR